MPARRGCAQFSLDFFGTFWAGEGIGIAWPGDDLSIVLLFAGYLGTSMGGANRGGRTGNGAAAGPCARATGGQLMRYVIGFGRFWFDFLIGDRPELFIGPIVGLALVAVVTHLGWVAISGLLLFSLVVASRAWGLARDLAAARAR